MELVVIKIAREYNKFFNRVICWKVYVCIDLLRFLQRNQSKNERIKSRSTQKLIHRSVIPADEEVDYSFHQRRIPLDRHKTGYGELNHRSFVCLSICINSLSRRQKKKNGITFLSFSNFMGNMRNYVNVFFFLILFMGIDISCARDFFYY